MTVNIVVAVILGCLALPTVVPYAIRWVRHERDLSRRVRQYEQREEAARDIRVRW